MVFHDDQQFNFYLYSFLFPFLPILFFQCNGVKAIFLGQEFLQLEHFHPFLQSYLTKLNRPPVFPYLFKFSQYHQLKYRLYESPTTLLHYDVKLPLFYHFLVPNSEVKITFLSSNHFPLQLNCSKQLPRIWQNLRSMHIFYHLLTL